jgi:hypothetical protein
VGLALGIKQKATYVCVCTMGVQEPEKLVVGLALGRHWAHLVTAIFLPSQNQFDDDLVWHLVFPIEIGVVL